MSKPVPAEPNREAADGDLDRELATRESSADPGKDAADVDEESSATAGD